MEVQGQGVWKVITPGHTSTQVQWDYEFHPQLLSTGLPEAQLAFAPWGGGTPRQTGLGPLGPGFQLSLSHLPEGNSEVAWWGRGKDRSNEPEVGPTQPTALLQARQHRSCGEG